MRLPFLSKSTEVPAEVQEDHTAFQTFLLYGIPIGVPNETLDRIKEVMKQNNLDPDPQQYIMRANDLVADIAQIPKDFEARQRAFDAMSEETRLRLLPNIAALLIAGVRSWPDYTDGELSAS
ncbi:MAG: hypothetical protein ABJN42_13735 [Roseibium sp.]|uniref:hypothetical protein n=1 Tax=Roseibium sp. TaxID=1936156 RepID=UPI003298B3EB